MTLILASGSAIRRHMLEAAGVTFEVDVPRVDEDAAKASLRADGLSPRDQADALAELKALSVSQRREGLVIGADQMLALDGETSRQAEGSRRGARALAAPARAHASADVRGGGRARRRGDLAARRDAAS